MPNMTRAEAVCVCTNILDLIESMDDRLPGDFAGGINDRARSMKERITKSTQFPTITEGMDRALRNMWGALRKWDRQDEHNDEMFYGLDETLRELAELDEDDKDFSVSDTGDARPAKLRKALEESFDFQKEALNNPTFNKKQADAEEAQRAYKGRQDAEREQSKAQSQERNERRKASAAASGGDIQRRGAPNAETKNAPPSLTLEDICKTREAAVAVVLNQVYAKKIRVLDSATIQHCDLGDILKKTTSDRTQQLIFAAWYSGKISGARMMSEDVMDLLKRQVKER